LRQHVDVGARQLVGEEVTSDDVAAIANTGGAQGRVGAVDHIGLIEEHAEEVRVSREQDAEGGAVASADVSHPAHPAPVVAQYMYPQPLCGRACCSNQPRLADPGRTLNQDRRPRPRPNLLQQAINPRELPLTLQRPTRSREKSRRGHHTH
jgi:hypothetical protein